MKAIFVAGALMLLIWPADAAARKCLYPGEVASVLANGQTWCATPVKVARVAKHRAGKHHVRKIRIARKVA